MKTPVVSHLFCLLALAALAPSGGAQVISGRVVNSSGVGVPGVNIDGFDSSGNDLTLANDGTDASGNFTTTVIDGPGVYRFEFYPPIPPVTTYLCTARDNIVVVTTTNLGDTTVGNGVQLTGRTIRSGVIPVANVLVTVIDGPTGDVVLNAQTKTNAFGTFNLAVPKHKIELQLNATGLAFVLGSRAIERWPYANLALGDIYLPPAALVTGHVQRADLTPVAGLDLDFTLVATGKKAFTPEDNTDAAGNFSVVVAKGTYDVELCADMADLLVTLVVPNVTISGPLNAGTTTMSGGVELSGTVITAHGAPAAAVDADVFDALTSAPIPLCHDNTASDGTYAVVVPTGTLDVVFQYKELPRSADLHQDVVVNAQTPLDGELPAYRVVTLIDRAIVEAGDVLVPLVAAPGPKLESGGAKLPGLTEGLPVTLELTGNGLGIVGLASGAPVLLLVGTSPTVLSGDATSSLARVLALRTNAQGVALVPLDVLARGPTPLYLRALGFAPHSVQASEIHLLRR